jgi:uncharacterized surface protein with fasciclin (FAS1) repeats
MKRLINFRNVLLMAFSLMLGSSAFTSCSDDPAPKDYYTFTGEMVSDFLTSRSAKFSDFITILERAKVYDLLSTYGEFTCFAPTNDAVKEYLETRGLTSLSQLTDADCDTIAYTHIIKTGAYFTTDLNDGAIPATNMDDRYLTISNDTDANKHIIYYINKTARIIARDDSVENGVVHTINKVISSSNDMLPDMLSKDQNATLFYAALRATHLEDSLRRYIDTHYTCGEDSIVDGVPYHTAAEYEFAHYLEKHKYDYTAFVEPDTVYKRNGINTLADLEAYAKKIYDQTYPEDAGLYDKDLTNRKNPLNRFIAYHLWNRLGNYNALTLTGDGYKIQIMANLLDAKDYYETMCPHTIMKISYSNSQMYINRRGLGNKATVPGVRIMTPSETSNVDQSALNGVYHYVTDIVTYNPTVRDIVFNERMRIDATTLAPEFMNSGARGKASTGTGQNDPCTGFKPGTLEGWSYTDATLVSCRCRNYYFWSYQGDEVILLGQYDFSVKLPPVPEGTYEVRLGYCGGFTSRGVIQVYFDGKPCGIPLDIRKGGEDDPRIGWTALTTNEETNRANDKAMRNRGYYAGGKGIAFGSLSSRSTFRSQSRILRRILTTTYIDDKKDHYMRFKQTLDNTKAEFEFDYLELCPKSVYDSEQGDDGL